MVVRDQFGAVYDECTSLPNEAILIHDNCSNILDGDLSGLP